MFDGLNAAELFITSSAEFSTEAPMEKGFSLIDMPDIVVVTKQAEGKKCGRCWKVLSEVGQDAKTPDICGRCSEAILHQEANV